MNQKTIKNVIKGLLISYIITFILLLVMALLLWKLNMSNDIISVGMILTYVLSSVTAGIYVGKKQREKKFLWGILMGALYAVIVLIATILVKGMQAMVVKDVLFAVILCILSGMLGGMVA